MTTQESQHDVLAIAKMQKGVLGCVIGNLIWPMVPVFFLVVLPFQVYFVYRLATLTRIGYPPLWVLGMFVPFINLLMLLIMAYESSKIIRDAGFEVGFFGANLETIKKSQT